MLNSYKQLVFSLIAYWWPFLVWFSIDDCFLFDLPSSAEDEAETVRKEAARRRQEEEDREYEEERRQREEERERREQDAWEREQRALRDMQREQVFIISLITRTGPYYYYYITYNENRSLLYHL